MNREKAIREIRKEFETRKVYCLVGSGLSAFAGIPTWQGLLQEMGKELKEFDEDLYKRFNALVRDRSYLEAGDLWKQSDVFPDKKQDLFNRLFIDEKYPQSIHRQLICIDFRGILTTNYDHLIEDAYANVRGRSCAGISTNQISEEQTSRFFVAKLNGDASDWKTVVVGGDDFNKVSWPDVLKKLLNNETLIVVGFGGSDPLMNTLLQSLPDTHIFVVMSPERTKEYKSFLGRSNINKPGNIRIVSIEHEDLEEFLNELRPDVASNRVIDCPWGKMPAPRPTVFFKDAMDSIQNFMSSNNKLVCLTAESGTGMSSFLSNIVQDFSHRGDCYIYRMEGKEWLSLDAYVLHILGNMLERGLQTYTRIRRGQTSGWSDESEATALSQAFHSMGLRVIIVFEHADRLSNRSLGFLSQVISQAPSDFKMIISAPSLIELVSNTVHIDLGQPSKDSLAHFCSGVLTGKGTADELLSSIRRLDLCALRICGCLIAHYVLSFDDLKQRDYRLKTLCKNAIRALGRLPKGIECLRLLKACTIFRTPRNIRSLSKCSGLDSLSVKNHLESICSYGLLIRSVVSKEPEFAMSTSVRKELRELLKWEHDDWANMSSAAARFFEEQIFHVLQKSNYTRKELIRVIPLISCALYHYREANNRDEYVSLISRVRRHTQYLYHFQILEEWLEDDAIPSGKGTHDSLSEYRIAYTKARIARIQALPKYIEPSLKNAERALSMAKKKGRSPQEEEEQLYHEKGIFQSMKRNYPEALKQFKDCYNNRSWSWDYKLRNLERTIQTYMSLGRLKEADSSLRLLKRRISNPPKSNKRRLGHHMAMFHRHRSTLSTLRLGLYDFRKKTTRITRQDLLKIALQEAKACREESEKQGFSPSSYTLRDETGIGVSYLKEAQAYYMAMEYAKACDSAEKAVGFFAGYPNNRWWRMCSHDLIARASIMIGDLQKALAHLESANDIFGVDSSQRDIVRKCELLRTKGLLRLKEGEITEALSLLESSLAFSKTNGLTSPCISWFHTVDLAKVYLEIGDVSMARTILTEAANIMIDW